MYKTFFAGIICVTAMSHVGAVAGEVLEDGWYQFSITYDGDTLVAPAQIKKVSTYEPSGSNLEFRNRLKGDGVYEIRVAGEGFLNAANGRAGTNVTGSESKKTRFVLHKWSNGWSIMHAEDPDNAVSFNNGGPKPLQLNLRRFDAAGRGNKDQIWKITKQSGR